jgi:hypothetical protein
LRSFACWAAGESPRTDYCYLDCVSKLETHEEGTYPGLALILIVFVVELFSEKVTISLRGPFRFRRLTRHEDLEGPLASRRLTALYQV